MSDYRGHPALHNVPVFFLILAFGMAALTGPSVQAQDLPGNLYEVQGKILDADQKPLEKATATLYKPDGSQGATAATDAQGNYKFSSLAAGNYSITGSHDCCLRASVSVAVGGLGATVTAPDLVLEAKPPADSDDTVTFSGRVKDAKSAKALAGALLQIQSYYTDQSCPDTESGDCLKPQYEQVQYFEVRSDSAGSFEIEINRGRADVRAYLDGYDVTQGFLDMSEDRSVEVPMRAAGGAVSRLFGVLRDEKGNPIAGGWINAGPDYDGGCGEGHACAVPATSPVDSDGQWTFEAAQQQYNSTQSAKDGSWEMLIAPGRLRVSAYAEDHLEDWAVVDAPADGSAEARLTLERLPPDSVSVTGRVTDLSDGSPVPYADVNVENQKWGSWAHAQTDADGRFELKTKPGYSILTISAYKYYYRPCEAESPPEPGPGGGDGDEPSIARPMPACDQGERAKDYLPSIRSFDASPDQSLSFDGALRSRAPPTSTFQGYVLNASSKQPVVGASVTFYNEETRDWGQATTDQDGSYKIVVHAGYYTIRIWAEGYFDGVANLEIAPDEVQRADFELSPGQKRYGYWAYGGYAVAERSASDAAAAGPGVPPPNAGPQATEAPPEPTEGQKAYVGAPGGLGPYHPPVEQDGDKGGDAPYPGIAVLMAAIVVAVAVRRRR